VNTPATAARQHALATLTRAQCALHQLENWAKDNADPKRERGSYSTEMTVVIAAIVLLAIAVVAIIAKKVLDKANSISI
jgi:hypothetical protein